jgi:SseB protein C-terminal domain
LFWRRRNRTEEMDLLDAPRFLGEQDGPAERELKTLLAQELAVTPCARRAYLARVEHSGTTHVALCVIGPQDANLVERVASRFASMFGSNEHLDIMFLDDHQELRLQTVCTPFYASG